MIPDKTRLLDELRKLVATDLAALARRQQDTQRGATHEENRAEHAKDTRATEQSYLARGLAKRVEEMRQTADNLSTLSLKSFDAEDPIGLTALVVLRDADDSTHQTWWLVPGPGGLELSPDDQPVRTLTAAAPLGRALMGLQVGDEGSFSTPRGKRSFEVLEIA
jgi:transcription elongation GreA/GreB family factor